MIKRKRKIINKEFQLKTVYRIMGIIIVAFLIIIAILGIEATQKNKEMSLVVKDISAAAELINSNIIATQQSAADSQNAIQTINANIDKINKLKSGNFRIISIMLAVVLIMSFILYFYLLNLTHRISGPLHVIQQYMDSINEGVFPEFRELREKDEFKNFYYTFVKMIETLKNEDADN